MALLNTRTSFSGGVFLDEGKSVTQHRPFADLPTPERLIVPLAQGNELPAESCVSPGQDLSAGQPLAVSPENASPRRSPPVHAPVAATVVDNTFVDTPYRDRVAAVELRTNAGAIRPQAGVPEGLPAWSAAELLQRARDGGIALPEVGLPGGARLDHLIVNGLESEPVQAVRLRTLIEHGQAVVETSAWLGGILNARRVHLIVDRARRSLLARLRAAARGTPVRVVSAPNKYPQSFTPLVVRAVTRREVPCGGQPEDIGVSTIDVCTLLALQQAARAGVARTWIAVTVAGDAVPEPANLRVPLGTTVGYIARSVGARPPWSRVVAGNLFAAPALRSPGTVLTTHTSALLFLRYAPPAVRDPVGCIRCGLCQSHCPVGIDPRAVLDLVERRRLDEAGQRHPAACIDCGLCDYMCPSSLPLMRAVQRSRRHALGV